jgi:hypothetical protein
MVQVGSGNLQAVAGNLGDITPEYLSLLPLVDDAPALLAEVNLVLAANQPPSGSPQGRQGRGPQAVA